MKGSVELVTYSDNRAQSKRNILEYLKKYRDAYAGDIAIALHMDIDLVFSIMKELRSEGLVE